jgi:aspartyl-tRNA(Asn)/glutamyl-tRNA(Gln) amidotransferase subunit C
MSKIDKKQVEHIAKLSRIKLSEEEKEKFSSELSQILDYFETLKKVDTENVSPASQATGIKNVLREDKEEKIEKKARDERRKKILENIPRKEGEYIKVKSVQ